MNMIQGSSKLVKPVYEGNSTPSITQHIPLSVFDKVTYDIHIGVIYVYRPPNQNNFSIEQGLQKALSEYRVLAGRLGKDHKGNPVILLNDEGVKFVEASVQCTLNQAMSTLKTPYSRTLLSFHPSVKGVEELAQVQLTRFICGSLVVGFTCQHLVADGHATSNFLVSWGQACRGLDINPRPFNDRTIFVPQDPPRFEFEHKEIEYTSNKLNKTYPFIDDDDIIVHKVHFTLKFLAKLKAKASSARGNNKPYSTFETLVAHLWRVTTKARGLNEFQKTQLKISVNGRSRLSPRVPDQYFGNLVLWAFPTTRVKDLLHQPISYAAEVIHKAVAKVNDNYFKSFIDFSSSKVVQEGTDLIPTADANNTVLQPNLEVDSWLRFPFCEMELDGGNPYIFMPSYLPLEGQIFLLPSFIGDGSIDAYIAMFQQNSACFKKICYSLD